MNNEESRAYRRRSPVCSLTNPRGAWGRKGIILANRAYDGVFKDSDGKKIEGKREIKGKKAEIKRHWE